MEIIPVFSTDYKPSITKTIVSLGSIVLDNSFARNFTRVRNVISFPLIGNGESGMEREYNLTMNVDMGTPIFDKDQSLRVHVFDQLMIIHNLSVEIC